MKFKERGTNSKIDLKAAAIAYYGSIKWKHLAYRIY